MRSFTGRVTVWSALTAAALLASSGSAFPAVGQSEGASVADPSVTTAEAIAGVERALVRVEYRLREDNGETPDAEGLAAGMGGLPGMGAMMASMRSMMPRGFMMPLDQYIRDERPVEMPGYLIGDRTVVTGDPLIHPRYVESIRVRFGDEVVGAGPSSWGIDEAASVLTLDAPLPGTRALSFDGEGDPAFVVAHARDASGYWATTAGAAGGALVRDELGRSESMGLDDALLLDAEGRPIGLTMTGLTAPDAAGTSPTSWAMMDHDAYTEAMSGTWMPAMHAMARRAILNFRSPAQAGEVNMWGGFGGGAEYDGQVEMLAVMLDDRHGVVLLDLQHEATARLESIRLADVSGESVEAEFVGSLRDWGAFVVRVDQTVPNVRVAPVDDLRAHRHELLPATEARLVGEDLVFYPRHARFQGFDLGRRGMAHPTGSYIAEVGMVFTRGGELLTLPIARRASAEDRDGWFSEQARPTPAASLAALLGDLGDAVDPTNAPLSEEDEARIAWLGVEMQPMDPDLARLSDVSEPTQGGVIGGVVNWVYAGSPAERAGIELGDVIVRVHAESEPRPMDVQVMGDMFGGAFPWEMLGEIPDEFFDQVPTPWPSVRSELNKMLTALGYGTQVELEIYRNGEEIRVPMAVVESPRHYGTAAKEESEAVGLTVRDTTFEVRRYFRLGDDEPALIVSKLEPGGRASVAGLRPYELITEVDGEPVGSVEALIDRMEEPGEVRLTVRRMTRSRVVSVRTGG